MVFKDRHLPDRPEGKKLMRLAFWLKLLLIGFVITAHPMPSWADGDETAQADDAAEKKVSDFIQDLGDRAMAVIADKSMNAGARTQRYEAILRRSFDLPTLGRFVLGRSWRAATPEQRQDYMKLFEALVVKIYGQQLNLYHGEKFRVKKARRESEKDFMVSSEIAHPDDAPATIVDWRVREHDGTLAVIDVIIEGVSQSVTQRQEYATIIQRHGIDGLLVSMRERLAGE